MHTETIHTEDGISASACISKGIDITWDRKATKLWELMGNSAHALLLFFKVVSKPSNP